MADAFSTFSKTEEYPRFAANLLAFYADAQRRGVSHDDFFDYVSALTKFCEQRHKDGNTDDQTIIKDFEAQYGGKLI